jgi:hypothetical protein
VRSRRFSFGWRWDYWYHRERPIEEAFILNKFLLVAPLPWRFAGQWERRAVRINLNKILVSPDENFHSHPATAIRIILKGGYKEWEWRADGNHISRTWRPGMIGVMPPGYRHRIYELLGGPSYTLWLRGVVTSDIWYVADGLEKTIKIVSNPVRRRTF